MKYIRLILVLVSLGLLSVSCDRDLPYPIDQTINSVVVDVYPVDGSDKVLSAGEVKGNYKAQISIPTQQGDYSMLDKVQLLGVFQDNQGNITSKILQDDIGDLPVVLNIDIEKIYNEFGKVSPDFGEILYLTANVVLKGGKIIPGWTEYTGFNNRAFTGWQVDNRAYSYNVRYPVVCPLVLEEFEGTLNVDDGSEVYKVNGKKVSETTIELVGIQGLKVPVPVVIDPSDHTVTIPKTILAPSFGQYHNLFIEGKGTIDMCNGKITFVGDLGVDEGYFLIDNQWTISN